MRDSQVAFRLPKPKGALLWFMVALGVVWIAFAIAINWLGVASAKDAFQLLAGSTNRVFMGHLWRLLTATLIHNPSAPEHPLIVLLLLFFFATSLEEAWGTKRLFLFFCGSAAFAYGLQALLTLVYRPLTPDTWYGAMVLADAATVAWAFNNRNQIVRLFFLIPVRPIVMVGLLVIWHVLLVIARRPPTEGLVAPFGAILAGWMFCDNTPLRKLWLKLKLRRLQAEVDSMQKKRKRKRDDGPDLRVIKGGRDDEDEPPDPFSLH